MLVLSLTFAGMIIHLGNFQGTDSDATTPAQVTSTTPPAVQGQSLVPASPALNGSFGNGAEPGDGTEDGGLQSRTSTVTPRGLNASTALNGSTRLANGGAGMN
jgi:hypothetical protein